MDMDHDMLDFMDGLRTVEILGLVLHVNESWFYTAVQIDSSDRLDRIKPGDILNGLRTAGDNFLEEHEEMLIIKEKCPKVIMMLEVNVEFSHINDEGFDDRTHQVSVVSGET